MPDDNANPELTQGPGGVGTPTPEPGPTPTPQPAAELKPVSDLLKPQAAADAPAADADAAKPATEPAVPEPSAEEKARSETQARIDALTREKWQTRREKEAIEARLRLAEETIAAMGKPQGDAADADAQPQGERKFTEAELQAEADRRAKIVAAQNDFNRQADAMVMQGRKDHADFDVAIEGLKKITGPVVPGELVAAALQTGVGADIIYHLGTNAADADRILSLPLIPQAVAIAQLAQDIKAAAPQADPLARVSRAPKPIVPKIGGIAVAEPSLETMPMADFIAKRNEAEAAARAARRR